MRLTRYELTFFGERQDVGFIQGLKDQSIPALTVQKYLQTFEEELIIPVFPIEFVEAGVNYLASYFTECGSIRFKEEIEALISYVEGKGDGWEVERIEVDMEAVQRQMKYLDTYQALVLQMYSGVE